MAPLMLIAVIIKKEKTVNVCWQLLTSITCAIEVKMAQVGHLFVIVVMINSLKCTLGLQSYCHN